MDYPENREWFLEVVSKGEYGAVEASKLLGTYWNSVKRYGQRHQPFGDDIDLALRRGRAARAALRKIKTAPPKVTRRKKLYVDEAEPPTKSESPDVLAPAPPRLLADGTPVPPLSIQAYLDEQWYIIKNRKAENPRVVTTAQRVLGALVVRPESGAIPGYVPPVTTEPDGTTVDARPKVVLMAPDNGTYAPGCGPVADGEDEGAA